MPVTPDEFRHALSHFASGVAVVTTRDADGKYHGITVSAFSSVSLTPPLVLICIEKTTASHYAFGESGVFVVNILGDMQSPLSERFASPFIDKFDDVEFSPGIDGLPVLNDALASLECHIVSTHDAGDHTIFVGSVEKTTVRNGDPLLHYRGKYAEIKE